MKKNWIKKAKDKYIEIKQLKVISETDLLEENHSKISNYLLILLLFFTLVTSIIWAVFTDVDEIAKTSGEIVPHTKIQIIQHESGGTVSEVFVSDGQRVKKNQALIKLDPAKVKAELEKAIIQAISLTADKIRLKSKLNNEHFHFKQLVTQIKKEIVIPSSFEESINSMLKDETLLHALDKSTDNSEISALKQRVEQHKIELSLLNEKSIMLKELMDVMQEEQSMYKRLGQNGLASKREMLSTKRQFLRIKKEWLESGKQVEKQKRILVESKNKLKQELSTNSLQSATSLNNINNELLQTQRNIEKLESQYQKLVIRAPVQGIIKGLQVSPGSVVTANETITEVVPTSSTLLVEAKINSRDIGHVTVGSKVKIKVTAFDYARYGVLRGKLKRLSATTFYDEKTNKVYYKGIINLDKTYLSRGQQRYDLIPGMLVEADIITGKKSIMEYLLKPIYNSLNNAMTER